MILPSNYSILKHQNPSAFLIELEMVELYLSKYAEEKGEKPPFSQLSQQMKGENTDTKAKKQFESFLEVVYEDMVSTNTLLDKEFPRSSIGKEVLREMESFHKKLIDEEKGNSFYKALYLPTLPAIIELTKKYPTLALLGEVARYQKIVFLYTMMEMAGQKPSDMTAKALEQFSNLLNALGELLMKRKDSDSQMNKSNSEQDV